jgi:hypothetical protein
MTMVAEEEVTVSQLKEKILNNSADRVRKNICLQEILDMDQVQDI